MDAGGLYFCLGVCENCLGIACVERGDEEINLRVRRRVNG